MKLSILIEWDEQDCGNHKSVMGARAYWAGSEISVSSMPFEAGDPEQVLRAKNELFDPILGKLKERLMK